MFSNVGCGIRRITLINTWHVHWQLDDLQESLFSQLILTNSVSAALSIWFLTRYTVWGQHFSFGPLRALALVVVLRTKITTENYQSISFDFTYVYEGPISHRLLPLSLRHIFRKYINMLCSYLLIGTGCFPVPGTCVTSAITAIHVGLLPYVCVFLICALLIEMYNLMYSNVNVFQ